MFFCIGGKIAASLSPVCCWIQRDTSRPWHKWTVIMSPHSPRYSQHASRTSNMYIRRYICIRIQVARPGYMFPDDMCPDANAALVFMAPTWCSNKVISVRRLEVTSCASLKCHNATSCTVYSCRILFNRIVFHAYYTHSADSRRLWLNPWIYFLDWIFTDRVSFLTSKATVSPQQLQLIIIIIIIIMSLCCCTYRLHYTTETWKSTVTGNIRQKWDVGLFHVSEHGIGLHPTFDECYR